MPELAYPSAATMPPPQSAEPRGQRGREWHDAARRVRMLSWLSLVWMGAEGAIAITAGLAAGSVALLGFGLDSLIEGLASLVIVWRFTGARLHSTEAEGRAQKLVAAQFFVLAPLVGVEAIRHLLGASEVDVSIAGMALTASSVVGMPLLGLAKQRAARRLTSVATYGEGTQNLLCAYLAVAVFVGLAGNALLGWWWLDPIAALVIVGVAVREGVNTWRGEGCCAPPALDITGPVSDCCAPFVQETCCEAEAKAECCADTSGACGCSAGAADRPHLLQL